MDGRGNVIRRIPSPTLDHESFDDTVESTSFVGKTFRSLFAAAQDTEVLCGARDDIGEKLKDNTAHCRSREGL